MVLKALRIANFKAFGPSQRVPMRPITLLYGANSAGKSSVLHALVLAHDAIETGELDTERTRLGGESVDLGKFRRYVHRRQRDREVEFAFEMDPDGMTGRMAELLRSATGVVVELGIRSGATPDGKDDSAVHLARFSVEVDGEPLLSMSSRRGGVLRLDRLHHGHPVFREVFRGVVRLGTTAQEIQEEEFADIADVLDELVPGITAQRDGLFPRVARAAARETAGDLVAISRGRRRADLARAAQFFLPRLVRDLVDGLSSVLETDLQRLSYLGPLRSYPPRHLTFSQPPDFNWFSGGGFAWEMVRTRDDIRGRVNEWLEDPERLKTPYKLLVRRLLPAASLPAEVSSRLEATMHDLTVSVLEGVERGEDDRLALALDAVRENIGRESDIGKQTLAAVADLVNEKCDTEEIARNWVQGVVEAAHDALSDLVLVDKRAGTIMSHRDVGTGVSQVLPVLIAAYASTGRFLAIEQPEIHLHPGLQAELGDVFIESALGDSDNTFLIETHSEHLLLRIMRRIRQTAAGELPEGIPAVRPEDVMVLFVEPDGARSLVREMPLNERGELVKAWPGGFFEEGMREIF